MSGDGYVYSSETFEIADTGIGKSLGFESDKAFLEHQRAEEAKLGPAVQRALQEHRAEVRRRMFFG